MKTGAMTIYRDQKKEWRWRVKSTNGRILADSGEGYKRKVDLKKALADVQHFFDYYES